MPLRDSYGRSTLALIRLAENPDLVADFLRAYRKHKGVAEDALQPEESFWLTGVAIGQILRDALEDLTPEDILSLWSAKSNRAKAHGNQGELIYLIAGAHKANSSDSLTSVYNTMVLPWLLATGKIQTDENGEPDPHQDLDAKKRFFKAMDRYRKRFP